MLGNGNIDQVDSFSYLDGIISNNGGCRKDKKRQKSYVAERFIFTVKNKFVKIVFRTNIRMLETTVITVVNHGSKT